MASHVLSSSPERFVNFRYSEIKNKKRLYEDVEIGDTYPTPHPSSALGEYSSPVKENRVTHLEAIRALRKQVVRSSIVHKVEVPLDPQDSSPLTVGRMKSVCDIHLPKAKHISRKHAVVSYLARTNQVRLTCNGMNGLIVKFPFNFDYEWRKFNGDAPIYELVTEVPSGVGERVLNTKKAPVQRSLSASFALYMGETVFFPFIENTIVDFRQCEGHLIMLKDATNETSNGEELTSTSGDFKYNQSKLEKTDICNDPKFTVGASLNETGIMPSIEVSENTTKCILPISPSSICTSTPVETRKSIYNRLQNIFEQNPGEGSSRDKNEEAESDVPYKLPKTLERYKENVGDTENTMRELVHLGVETQELQNVLANRLAFSNMQQIPLSSLQEVNSEIFKLSRKQLRALLASEKCIGIIYRSGKDAAGKPLDEEYYYDIENDSNEDRRRVIMSLKGGRTGLRACRKFHKQYFWKKPAK